MLVCAHLGFVVEGSTRNHTCPGVVVSRSSPKGALAVGIPVCGVYPHHACFLVAHSHIQIWISDLDVAAAQIRILFES